jgi:hypothetical protein
LSFCQARGMGKKKGRLLSYDVIIPAVLSWEQSGNERCVSSDDVIYQEKFRRKGFSINLHKPQRIDTYVPGGDCSGI